MINMASMVSVSFRSIFFSRLVGSGGMVCDGYRTLNTEMKTTFDASLTLTTAWRIIPQNGELLKVSLNRN